MKLFNGNIDSSVINLIIRDKIERCIESNNWSVKQYSREVDIPSIKLYGLLHGIITINTFTVEELTQIMVYHDIDPHSIIA